MLRRVFFGSGTNVAAIAELNYELVKEPKSLESTVSTMLRETEKRQGLVDLPPINKREFAMAAKTKEGKLAGGIFGYTNYNEAHIAMLAINPECAIPGMGTALLKSFEMAARSRYNCNRLALETFSWQARPFYEKFGFQLFGVQKNQPIGHEKYFMERVWPAEQNKEAPSCYMNAAEGLTIDDWRVDAASTQLAAWLDADAQNRKIEGVPLYDMTPFGLRVTDTDGTLVACCLYETWWNELHLDKLVVVPDKQHKGVGSAVLKRIEEIAREKKLQHLVADTMSWQAHPFYEKHGFKVFATQKDVPKGHSHLRLLRVLK
jgi:N-acetylglutamate synthase-like GNAT family acetyltransferase